MYRLTIREKEFIKLILRTSRQELFNLIKVEDKKEKAQILDEIELFKRLYAKDQLESTKETVNILHKQLDEVNQRIKRISNE